MKVLVAGATGVIGRPLINRLIQAGQETYGITQSDKGASFLAAAGARPVILNILDVQAVLAALQSIRPEVIIDMLTSLPKHYTPEAMRDAAAADSHLRLEGGRNLQSAAEAVGVRRYVVQSSAFWYAPGVGLADETEPFAFDATPGISAGVRVYSEIEKRVLQSKDIEGIALRFGFFYGPGTWFNPDGDVADQICAQKFPLIGTGQGIWNFVHIEDAANAAAEAVYIHPGAYNITNNRPTALNEWLVAFARYLKAPNPSQIGEEEATKLFGADRVYYATKLRGASNAKAKQEFYFEPRAFEWFQ